MFSMVFVAGEDAAHTEFVRGFLTSFDFPMGRVNANPSRSRDEQGRRGDGKDRMFADARVAATFMRSRANYQSMILVVLHDLGDESRDRLRRRIVDRIAHEASADREALAQRIVVLLPEPETEGWIAAMLSSGYKPSEIGTKLALKRQAFHFGKEAGKSCRKGERDALPEQMRSFCDEVAQHVGNLR